MKYLTLIALLFSVAITNTFAQDKAKIKAAASISTTAFIKGDYATMADHTYPKLLAAMGGKDAFVQMLNTQIGNMKKQGLSIERIVVGEPGEIYTAGTNLLSLVPQTVSVKMQGKYITSTTNLLAVSSNKGKTWYFVDTSNGTVEQVKGMFPNWPGKLVIPPPSKPVYTNTLP